MMVVEKPRAFQWDVEKFLTARRVGLIGEDARYELFEGQLIDKTPQRDPHASLSLFFLAALTRAFGPGYDGHTDHPIRLRPGSEPEPDVTIFRGSGEDYLGRKVEALDVRLVLEVCAHSHALDFGDKRIAYATHGIEEYWILDLDANRLHVHRNPLGAEGYGTVEEIGPEGVIPYLLCDLGEILRKSRKG